MWLLFQHQSDATVGTRTFFSEQLRLLLVTDRGAEFVPLRTATPLSEDLATTVYVVYMLETKIPQSEVAVRIV